MERALALVSCAGKWLESARVKREMLRTCNGITFRNSVLLVEEIGRFGTAGVGKVFCLVKGSEELGFAKTVDDSGAQVTVEFFDAPGQTQIRKISKASVVKRRLAANTRIYYHDHSASAWPVGRIVSDDGDGVEIRLQGGTDLYVDYENVFVRWKKPIADPLAFLAHAVTETPMYAECRSAFRNCYINQRAATSGISSLLSSAIEVYPHQVDVVQRVLTDPAQRYMLADEVGLGKTIEAGVIIRQTVLDDPRFHRVVVAVPTALLQQWRAELSTRFGLTPYLDISVFVIPHGNADQLRAALVGATLLVIDEAHHIASPSNKCALLYEDFRLAAKTCPRLLLLSATPVLRNEAGFLRMLHLLDPVVYPLEDEDGFRAKVRNRQTLAEAVAAVDPENILQLDYVLDELERVLPDDLRAKELVAVVRRDIAGKFEADEAAIDSLRVLKAHLSETYRLHRRILRNRRKRIIGLTPRRVGGELILVHDRALQGIEREIDNWRVNAAAMFNERPEAEAQELENFHWSLLESLLSGVPDIPVRCEERLAAVRQGRRSFAFEGEEASLQRIRVAALADSDQLERKLELLVPKLKELIAAKFKPVIFCSDADVANSIVTGLGVRLPGVRVYRHDTRPQHASSWLPFLNFPDPSALICDESAEEGVNLQGGRKAVVHFDLPLQPNRIEQRLGRVDRFGSGDPIRSLVVIADSAIGKAWFDLLASGLGVFERSISSLQYLVEEQLRLLRPAVLEAGVESLADLTASLGGADGLAARELRLIDEQDALDELAPLTDEDISGLSEADDDWKAIEEATNGWAVKTLMFETVRDGGEASLGAPFRFRYRPASGSSATLIPLSGLLEDFIGAIDFDAPRSSSTSPLSYQYSYRRQSAISKRVRPLRYGSEFFEALRSFSYSDDRGRAYARWRQRVNAADAGTILCFEFSFLVEGNEALALSRDDMSKASAGDGPRAAVRRRLDSLFAPKVFTIWTDGDGELLDDPFVNEHLGAATSPNALRWRDTNLKASRFPQVLRLMPELFGSWPERCTRVRNRAFDRLVTDESLRTAIAEGVRKGLAEKDLRRVRLETRIRHLEGREAISEEGLLRSEMALCDAIVEAVRSPAVRLDVVGVVVLSGEPCPAVD